MLAHQINLRYDNNGDIGISIDETTTENDIQDLIAVFKQISQNSASINHTYPKRCHRYSAILQRTTSHTTHF